MSEVKTINVTDETFQNEVLESDLPVLVDYWAPWCGPCLMAGPVVEKIANEYDGRLKVCKVNVDESRQVAVAQQIMSIPTLLIFKGGEKRDQITGVTPNFEADLRKKIDTHVS